MKAGSGRGAKEGLCAECFKKATLNCAKCVEKGLQRWYCSQYCQLKDWHLGHKGNCGLADLPLPVKVPAPPTRLIRESVERPVLSDKQWSKLVEAVNLGPRPDPPRGLRNLGNSCYMNAVLQGIFHGAPALFTSCRDHCMRARCVTPAGPLKPGEGCFRCDLEAVSRTCLDPKGSSTSSTSASPAASKSADDASEDFASGDRVAIHGFKPSSMNGQEGIVENLDGENGSAAVRIGEQRIILPLENLVLKCRAAAGPMEMVRWLPRLGDDFTFGMQEDAHEYMRSLLRLLEHEELEEHEKALRKRSGEEGATEAAKLPMNADLTATPSRIFGGLLVSQCTCTNRECAANSFSFENFMDLSLDITEATDSLEDTLRLFTAPERLDKKNGFRCDTCQETVRARKQMRIYSAPDCLVLQLKRFRGGPRGKVGKPIAFSSKLNLAPFLSDGAPEAGKPLWYDLRAVIIHLDKFGYSNFGHYVACVRCSGENGKASWYLLDDSQAVEVTEEDVLRSQAYLLIYARASLAADGASKPASRKAESRATAKEASAGEASPSKCRGLNGGVCSFFACSDGLCTKCYVEKHGRTPPVAAPVEETSPAPVPTSLVNVACSSNAAAAKAPSKAVAAGGKSKKVGPNDPCPCGSGSKYKKCHGKS